MKLAAALLAALGLALTAGCPAGGGVAVPAAVELDWPDASPLGEIDAGVPSATEVTEAGASRAE